MTDEGLKAAFFVGELVFLAFFKGFCAKIYVKPLTIHMSCAIIVTSVQNVPNICQRRKHYEKKIFVIGACSTYVPLNGTDVLRHAPDVQKD